MRLKREPKNGKHRPMQHAALHTPECELPPPDPATRIDLPTLTGEMSGMLSQLRAEYGMAYTSRTWVELVLPQHAVSALPNPELARDLLATAALDAGGIRADVSAIIATNPGAAIIATAAALRDALEAVLAGCARSTEARPRPSDPTGWPPERM